MVWRVWRSEREREAMLFAVCHASEVIGVWVEKVWDIGTEVGENTWSERW
jgi:hypothetical protein